LGVFFAADGLSIFFFTSPRFVGGRVLFCFVASDGGTIFLATNGAAGGYLAVFAANTFVFALAVFGLAVFGFFAFDCLVNVCFCRLGTFIITSHYRSDVI